MSRLSTWLALGIVCWSPAAAWAQATPAADPAFDKYKIGFRLFESGHYDQALIEFRDVFDAAHVPAALYMIAQCEYVTGLYAEALAHFRQYVGENPAGEEVGRVKDRIRSIEKRQGTLILNASVTPFDFLVEGSGAAVKGQAPVRLPLPRGKYRLTVSKPNYETVVRDIEVEFDPRLEFFPLKPIPARLEIVTRTAPGDTRLYVDGNLVRNPFRQDVAPGPHEIFVEAKDHVDPLPLRVALGPGERLILDPEHEGVLPPGRYRRPGKTELVGWSSAIGAAVGAGAVFARAEDPTRPNLQVGTLAVLMGGVGALGGLIASSIAVPSDIDDDSALFVIGGMATGSLEGAFLAYAIRPTLRSGMTGGLLGLGAGTVVGAALRDRNPNYRRESFLLSTSAVGLSSGALLNFALGRHKEDAGVFALGGLNLGLGAGLLYAYGRDRASPDWSWRRSILVLMSALGGAALGASGVTLQQCIAPGGGDCQVTFAPRTATTALVGGFLGLGVGGFFTRNFDVDEHRPIKIYQPGAATAAFVPTLLPIGADGRGSAPGVATVGRF